ncbi:MAG: Gfo/Idh/MocA family oxidoreductase [Chloroflexi bacterium]|nr:Gfo/Idh/MocA family oxidoreductase [Chloroflexota bacterium]
MISPLRVGLIGCGAIAQIMHIPYLVDYDEKFELVALSDAYVPILEAVADHYHIAKRYTDWREMLEKEDIEAVVICHSGSHRDSVLASLAAGKHVFVEKPIAWNLREAKEVAVQAAQSHCVVQVAYHKRYDPAFQYAREQIQKMRDIGLVRVTVLHPPNEMGLSPHRIRRGNRLIDDGHQSVISLEEQINVQLGAFAGGSLGRLVDEALGSRKDNPALRLGYGIIASSMIHQIYTMHGFLGAPLRVLSTDIWRKGLSIHSVVEYPNDVRCTFDWHFLAHIKDYREEYAFYGNHDRVLLQMPSPYLKNAPSPVIVQGGDEELAWEKRVVVSYDEAFRNELLAFYENVRHNRQPATAVPEALQHMELIQQLIDAARV